MKNKQVLAIIKQQRDYLMRRLFFLIGEGMTIEEFEAHIAREMEHNAKHR